MSARTRLLLWGGDEPTLEALDEAEIGDVVLVEAHRNDGDPSVPDQVLALLDRMDDGGELGWTLALGPETFGWATTGQLSDLRGWAELSSVVLVTVYAPPADMHSERVELLATLSIDTARRLGGIASVRADLPRALEALASVVDGTWTGRTGATS